MCISAIQDEWLTLWANPPLSSFHPTQAIWLTNRGGGALCLIILQLLVLLTLFALLLQLLDPFLAHSPSPSLPYSMVAISTQSHNTTICVLLSMLREIALEVVIVTYLEKIEHILFYLIVWSHRGSCQSCWAHDTWSSFLPIFPFRHFSFVREDFIPQKY